MYRTPGRIRACVLQLTTRPRAPRCGRRPERPVPWTARSTPSCPPCRRSRSSRAAPVAKPEGPGSPDHPVHDDVPEPSRNPRKTRSTAGPPGRLPGTGRQRRRRGRRDRDRRPVLLLRARGVSPARPGEHRDSRRLRRTRRGRGAVELRVREPGPRQGPGHAPPLDRTQGTPVSWIGSEQRLDGGSFTDAPLRAQSTNETIRPGIRR